MTGKGGKGLRSREGEIAIPTQRRREAICLIRKERLTKGDFYRIESPVSPGGKRKKKNCGEDKFHQKSAFEKEEGNILRCGAHRPLPTFDSFVSALKGKNAERADL